LLLEILRISPKTLWFVLFRPSQLMKIPLPGEKASEIALLVKWLTRDNS
jgi:hypothetical protein